MPVNFQLHWLHINTDVCLAATWNFVNFQSPTYSAVIMEFTTPPSYGSTKVNVGCIATDDKIITAGSDALITHTSSKNDPEVGWPQPESASFVWSGQDDNGEKVNAEISGPLGARADRIDILNEVPAFVKTIIAAAAGTRPYIYQFQKNADMKIQVAGEEKDEQGRIFMEATFITGDGSSK